MEIVKMNKKIFMKYFKKFSILYFKHRRVTNASCSASSSSHRNEYKIRDMGKIIQINSKKNFKLFVLGFQLLIIFLSFQNCSSNTKLKDPITTVNTPVDGVSDPTNSNTSPDNTNPTASCSVTDLEATMTSTLNGVTNSSDFSFLVERHDGRQFSYNRGVSHLTDYYESASTSKLVSAVIILRAVDKGYLTLENKPQDFIKNNTGAVTWPIASTKPLYNYITLRKLLSFTSGLLVPDLDSTNISNSIVCLSDGTADFETCVKTIGFKNKDNTLSSSPQFYYSSSHLQVAGLMAIKASGVSSWQDLFTQFKNETGLFNTSTYDLPSATNPRLAGGMHWTALEYFAFLKAFKNGELLSSSLMNEMLSDQIANSELTYSPLIVALNEAWHYGFGSWQECQNTTYNCVSGTRISSPGAYGSYPYWDRNKNYIGIVANQATTTGNFHEGLDIERAVRSQVESWTSCQ